MLVIIILAGRRVVPPVVNFSIYVLFELDSRNERVCAERVHVGGCCEILPLKRSVSEVS